MADIISGVINEWIDQIEWYRETKCADLAYSHKIAQKDGLQVHTIVIACDHVADIKLKNEGKNEEILKRLLAKAFSKEGSRVVLKIIPMRKFIHVENEDYVPANVSPRK